MLANYYFMQRNFSLAVQEFERVLAKYPENKNIRKKIILCYIKTNELKKAFALFQSLVFQDIQYIMNTNFDDGFCPCPELIYEYENNFYFSDDNTNNLILGMLWLYCDIHESLRFFRMYLQNDPNNKSIQKLITHILKTLKEIPDGKEAYS